jgi:hypothetical protein
MTCLFTKNNPSLNIIIVTIVFRPAQRTILKELDINPPLFSNLSKVKKKKTTTTTDLKSKQQQLEICQTSVLFLAVGVGIPESQLQSSHCSSINFPKIRKFRISGLKS